MRQYVRLFSSYPGFLSFALLASFASSFGQTFFIGLFTDTFRASYNLSHGEFGAIYAVATLLGGLLLMRLGKQLDYVPLARFTWFSCLGLALSALLAAQVWHVTVLFVAIGGLRLFGQGFMGHLAMTSMGRYFTENRGKAVAIAGMGFPIGELLLPLILVALLTILPWQAAWYGVALLVVILAPLLVRLQRFKPTLNESTPPTAANLKQLSRQRDFIRDHSFWAVLPALLGLPFLVTAMLLNQLWFAAERGWSFATVASAIMIFSITRVTVSLLAGPLIDRIGSQRLIGANILPATLGAALLLLNPHSSAWWIFLALAGVSAGINAALSGTLWAELYGVNRLATIRALVHAMMVFSTALAPLVMGFMIDSGWSVDLIIGVFIVILLAAWANTARLGSNQAR